MANEPFTKLCTLSNLLSIQAEVDLAIIDVLGFPALRSNVGGFVAEQVFGVELLRSRFAQSKYGYLSLDDGRRVSVNVKYYLKWERQLDMHTGDTPPDYYLVLAGVDAVSWAIKDVFLISHADLLASGVTAAVPVSVPDALSEPARLFPTHAGIVPLSVTDEQAHALLQFGGPW